MSATVNATPTIKALAGAVLERNKYAIANATKANLAENHATNRATIFDDLLHAQSVEKFQPSSEHSVSIRNWLKYIGEDDAVIIAETLERYASDPDMLHYFLKRSAEMPETLLQQEGATCSTCSHWRRDTVGDGSGLGECLLNVNRRALPWPNQTACSLFEITKGGGANLARAAGPP